MHQGPVVVANQAAEHQWPLLGQQRDTTVWWFVLLGMRWEELPALRLSVVPWVERHTQLQLWAEVPREGRHSCCRQAVEPSLLDPVAVGLDCHQMAQSEVPFLLQVLPLAHQKGWSGHWPLLHHQHSCQKGCSWFHPALAVPTRRRHHMEAVEVAGNLHHTESLQALGAKTGLSHNASALDRHLARAVTP